MLVNQMQGTLNDFEEVLVFAKDLFCHSNQSLTAYWPKNWRETEKLLRNVVIRNLKSSQSALIKVILVIGIAPVTAILRKAILYNYNDPLHPGRRTVLDFQREIMPITWGDIQVPFHPQIDDMIFIKGDNPHPWLAKVLTICGELIRIAHTVSSSLDFYSSPLLFSLGFTTVTTPRLD